MGIRTAMNVHYIGVKGTKAHKVSINNSCTSTVSFVYAWNNIIRSFINLAFHLICLAFLN